MYDKNKSFENTIERQRIISDNMIVYLIGYADNKETKIDLSNYSLKSVSWTSRDELKVWKPCTRREEIAILKMKGFDIELNWAKNSPDLMSIYMDQHRFYYGGDSPSIDAHTIGNYGRLATSNKLGYNARTPYEDRKPNTKKSSVVSVYQNTKRFTDYLTPRFDLLVEILHPYLKNNIEGYLFKNVVLYGASQKTEENGSEIDETIKAFASWAEKRGNIQVSSKPANLVHDLLRNMTETNVEQPQEPFRDRKIINPSNFDYYRKQQ